MLPLAVFVAASTAHANADDANEPAASTTMSLQPIHIPRPAISRVEFSVDAQGADVEYAFPTPTGLNGRRLGGGADADTRVFLTPVIDDEAPISLQPYLQRVSTLTISADAFGSHIDYWDSFHTLSFNVTTLASTIGVDAYATRWLACWGTLGIAYDATRPSMLMAPTVFPTSASVTSIPLSTGFGFRWGDTRIDIGYGVTPTSQGAVGDPFTTRGWSPFAVTWWGGVQSAFRTVIRRRVAIGLVASLIQGGANAAISSELFPSSTLGIGASLSYLHGAVPAAVVDSIGARVSIEKWFTRRVGASVAYSLTWATGGNQSSFDSVLTLAIFGRV